MIIIAILPVFCYAKAGSENQKLGISIKTRDPFEIENYTPFAEYEPVSLSETSKIKPDSEWIILREDKHRLSDIDFLRLIGDKDKLKKAEKMINDEWTQVLRGAAFSTAGLLLFFTASNNAGQFALGGVLLGWGAFEYVSGATALDKQHIEPRYALKKVHEYNLKLK